MAIHHPLDCPKGTRGNSCGCDGAYDDGCWKCTLDQHVLAESDLAKQLKVLGTDSLLSPFSPTVAMINAMIRIRDFGPEAWAQGTKSRAGGAVTRMFDRLLAEGLVTKPPYKLTKAGRDAVKRWSPK